MPVLKDSWLLLEQTLADGVEFSLTNLLAKTESEQIASLLVKLSDNGQDIETLKGRLAGAIAALEEYNNKKLSRNTKTLNDEQLRKISSVKTKPDRRNPGLMPI